jgi:putative membrane protein
VKAPFALMLSLAACSPAPLPDNATQSAANATMTEPAPAVLKSPAQTFADTTAAGNAFKIASGNLGIEKATSPALKKYAKMLVDDGIQSMMKLKAASAQVPGVLPNPSLTAEQAANIATLQSASGAAFDQGFKAQQALANARMLAAQQSYAANGDAEPLRNFAEGNAPFVLRAVRLGKEL